MADLMDFMNKFIDSGRAEIDEEMYKIEKAYSEKFKHGVPREMIPPSISEPQIKEALKSCIESGNDNLFELLGVNIDTRNLY